MRAWRGFAKTARTRWLPSSYEAGDFLSREEPYGLVIFIFVEAECHIA